MLRFVQIGFFKFSKQLIEKSVREMPQNNMIKLSKWISMKSLCSRKEAEEFIRLGLVRIDGKRVYDNLMVPEDASMKAFTPVGVQVQKPVTRLWMMNKPRGYICSHHDPQKRPSIYQMLPPQFKLFGHIMSVGRLDFNSEGLLLLTNDVKLKNLLQNPIANMTRVYRVKVHGRVTPQKLLKMAKPIIINGKQYGPLQVTVDRALTTNVWLNVSMKTGKNRQIRRIMQSCDLQVNKLIRNEYGRYKLNSHGQIRELPISQGLERKLKLEKAKQLFKNSNRNCLIEIDIRQPAIQLATLEQQAKLMHQKQKKQSISEENNGQQKLKMLREKQQQDSQDNDNDIQ